MNNKAVWMIVSEATVKIIAAQTDDGEQNHIVRNYASHKPQHGRSQFISLPEQEMRRIINIT